MGLFQTLRRKVGCMRLHQAYMNSEPEQSEKTQQTPSTPFSPTPKSPKHSASNHSSCLTRCTTASTTPIPHFNPINWNAPSQRKQNGSIISSVDTLDKVTGQYSQQLQALAAHKADPTQLDFRGSLIWDNDNEDHLTSDDSIPSTPLTPNTHAARTVYEDSILNTLHGFPYQVGTGYNTHQPGNHGFKDQGGMLHTFHDFPYQIGPNSYSSPSRSSAQKASHTPRKYKYKHSHSPRTPNSPTSSTSSANCIPITCANPFEVVPLKSKDKPLEPFPRHTPTPSPPLTRKTFMSHRICARGFIDWFLATHAVIMWLQGQGWVGVEAVGEIGPGVSEAELVGGLLGLLREGMVRVLRAKGELEEGFVGGLLGEWL